LESPCYTFNRKINLNTYIFSRLRCMSLSLSRIFGVWLRRSSRNSVINKAALLYFSLELFTFS
jgi:hypothetical protein